MPRRSRAVARSFHVGDRENGTGNNCSRSARNHPRDEYNMQNGELDAESHRRRKTRNHQRDECDMQNRELEVECDRRRKAHNYREDECDAPSGEFEVDFTT